MALGDGDLVPFPEGLERLTSRWWIAGVLLAVLLLAALVVLRRRVA